MSLSTTMLAADYAYMLADLPQSFTWRGTSYACVATDATVGHTLIDEGYSESVNAMLTVAVALFASDMPKSGDVITYGSVDYRVAASGIIHAVDGITISIPLSSKTD